MITGSNSALKGFGLLLALVVAVLSLVGCIVSKNGVFIAASLANLGVVAGSAVYLYKKWSSEDEYI